MSVKKLNKRNKIEKVVLNLILLLIMVTTFISCNSSQKTTQPTSNNTISEVTTNQTALNKKDVINYFCSNLTEYFNAYKYYKISSTIYSTKEQQTSNSTSRITKRGSVYDVMYIGAAGIYTISFSNQGISEFEQIFTFARGTKIGNYNRKKIYDTFTGWLKRVEISLKAYNNSYLYTEELNAAVELENWYNSLN
jgi:hypothetical protein